MTPADRLPCSDTLDRHEVAQLMNVTLRTVSRWVANGTLPQPFRGGGRGSRQRWRLNDVLPIYFARLRDRMPKTERVPDDD